MSDVTPTCIICYSPINGDVKEDARETLTLRRFFLLLERHLDADHGEVDRVDELPVPLFEKLINAGMISCVTCSKVINSFCELYDKKKTIEGELNSNLMRLHGIIHGAEIDSERKKEFEKDCVKRLADFGDGVKEFVGSIFSFKSGLIIKCARKLKKTLDDICRPRGNKEGLNYSSPVISTADDAAVASPCSKKGRSESLEIDKVGVGNSETSESQAISFEGQQQQECQIETGDKELSTELEGNNEHEDGQGDNDNASGSEYKTISDSKGGEQQLTQGSGEELEGNGEMNQGQDNHNSRSVCKMPDTNLDSKGDQEVDNHESAYAEPPATSEYNVDENMERLSTDPEEKRDDEAGTKRIIVGKDNNETSGSEYEMRDTNSDSDCDGYDEKDCLETSAAPPPPLESDADEEEDLTLVMKMPILSMQIPPPILCNLPRGSIKVGNPHSIFDAETGRYKCGICLKEFMYNKSVNYHHKIVHLKIRYKCTLCHQQFTRQDRYNLHYKNRHASEGPRRRVTHTPKTAKTKTDQHKCQTCQETFTSAQNLLRHQKSVHLGVKFPCERCNKQFSRSDGLTRHQHTNCRSAETKRTSKNLISGQYKKTSTGKKNFQINLKTNNLQIESRINHMRRKRFNRKYRNSRLQQHLKTAHEDASAEALESNTLHRIPLPRCPVCLKTFSTQKILSRHYSIHIGVKFPCPRCKKHFSRKDNLSFHLRSNFCQPKVKEGSKKLLSDPNKKTRTGEGREEEFQTNARNSEVRGRGSEAYSIFEDLCMHSKTAREDTSAEDLECTVCGKKFDFGCELRAHRRNMHAEYPDQELNENMSQPRSFEK